MAAAAPAASPLESLDREALVTRCRELERRIAKLEEPDAKTKKAGKLRKQRPFDFSKCRWRKVAFKVAYLGERYHGLAAQKDVEDTIEAHFIAALQQACFIKDRESAMFSRCGRTDRGVSAFGQVLSLRVRTNEIACKGFMGPAVEGGEADAVKRKDEVNYVHILNKILPPDIRVLAWAPVEPDFDARFDCLSRTYKYYFFQDTLNLERMQQAADFYVGAHDFRNFCKPDTAGNVTNFERRILSFRIGDTSAAAPGAAGSDVDPRRRLCEITITGYAFLWHQVRCMVSVLFMVGRGEEDPEIVRDMLDLEKMPRKPQYRMASEQPLVLYDCTYEDLHWLYDAEAHRRLDEHFYSQWKESAMRTALWGGFLAGAEEAPLKTATEPERYELWRNVRQMATPDTVASQRAHRPLATRPVAPDVMVRIQEKRAQREASSGQ